MVHSYYEVVYVSHAILLIIIDCFAKIIIPEQFIDCLIGFGTGLRLLVWRDRSIEAGFMPIW